MLDEGAVITVDGPTDPDTLGITLTHEHILVDLWAYFAPDPDPIVAAELAGPMHIGMLGNLRRSLGNCADDLLLDDDQAAVAELQRFQLRGGRTVCDMSSHGIKVAEHERRLRDIARSVAINVVAGTGAYIDQFHPQWVRAESEAELAARFVGDITAGCNGIRCGVIGEIGLGDPPSGSEWKVLRAAGLAHLETGAPIVLHQREPTGKLAHQVLDVLEELGVRPDRVVIGHATVCDLEMTIAAMQRGAYAALDTIGIHGCAGTLDLPSENWYVTRTRELAERGGVNRLLLSHDVAHKRSLRRYGGCGYDHLQATIVPKLADSGMSASDIDQLLVANPRRLLTIGL